MPLAAGTRLGSYEIVAAIGAGGMGEVYKARDTRLDRFVAIKVLPPDVTGDADRLARFEREARSISALTHRSICTLYDVGVDAPTPYLVMEYLEGETLAQRLARGPLSQPQAFEIAAEISDALDHAHRRGIVHRDLKPGNVMLVKGGNAADGSQVKLLDFGLAKSTVIGSSAGGQEPVTATALTGSGTVIGTLPYMAPEQLQGANTDARADIWAFGCVLYEMLAHRRPFDGGNSAAIISAVMTSEPLPLTAQLPSLPVGTDLLVRACLTRDPDARLQSMRDARLTLQWLRADELRPTTGAAGSPSARTSRWPTWAIALVAFAAGGGLATTAWLQFATPSGASASGSARLSVPTPGAGVFNLQRTNIAVAPDGRQIVFVGREGGTSHLYKRPIDAFEATLIPGTDGAEGPFFSPDGRHIGFWVPTQLKRIDLDGGSASVICDAADLRGATWMPDDTVIFSASVNSGLSRVPASGGSPQPFTTLDASKHERVHRFPAATPDGRAVVFMIGTFDIQSFAEGQIVAQPLAGGPRAVLAQGGTAPQIADGRLFYVRADGLVAVPFDSGRLQVSGRPVVVAPDVGYASNFGTAHYGVARDGTVAYVPGGEIQPLKKMVWVTRDGARTVVGDQARFHNSVRLSPDGKQALLWDQAANDQVLAFDLERQTLSRLTFGGNANGGAWTPDGRYAVAVVGADLVRVRADGGGDAEVLVGGQTQKILPDVSPDADTVAYAVAQPGTGFDIWTYSLGTHKSAPWLSTKFNERAPRFSPDGKWVGYESDETGTFEVFVRSISGAGPKIQISSDGGRGVAWSRDSHELFYKRGDDVMAVQVQAATGTVAPARKLFSVVGGIGNPGFDVTADGRRFLVLESMPAPVPTLINVVLGGLSPRGAK